MGLPDVTPVSFVALCVLGLVLGSFGNVLVSRLPRSEAITGRSRCPRCGETLPWRDLVPLGSFLFLRGRCRFCRGRISLRYPLLEVATAAIVVAATVSRPPPENVVLVVALCLLLLIAVSDGETHRIPDALALPFILVCLAYGFLRGTLSTVPPLVGGGFFALQWIIGRGRWVGSGDIGLGLGLGFLVGDTANVLLALAVAYVLGAMVACALLLLGRRKRGDRIAFAPFIAAGAFATVFLESSLRGVFGL